MLRGSVLIDGRLIGYRHGGIPSYAKNLAELTPGIAPELDIRVALKRRAPILNDRSVRVFTPPHHRLERFAFGIEVMSRRVDLVHAVDYVQPIAPGVRSVVSVHDLAFLTRPDLLTDDAARYYNRIQFTIHHADHVIAVSDWTRQQLIKRLGLDDARVTVIPNGLDHQLFSPNRDGDREVLSQIHPRLHRLIQAGRPVVLAVGTLEPRKRTNLLVEAFRQLEREGDSARNDAPLLVVAGQCGWLADGTVDRLRSLQRTDNAVWLRDVTDREMAALYRASRLVVMPSIDEGFGLPVLEAMASGTPTLVSLNGALPELADDAGYLESSDSPAQWMKRIMGILHDSSGRRAAADRGLARAREFSWARTAELTVDVYRRVLERR